MAVGQPMGGPDDPALGQAMDAEAAQNDAQNRYMEQEAGVFMHGLESMPGGTAFGLPLSAAITHRGANTIIRGGWSPDRMPRANLNTMPGAIREGVRQRAGSPKAALRYANQDIFHGTGPIGYTDPKFTGGQSRRAYSPYWGSSIANAAGRMMSGDTVHMQRASQRLSKTGAAQALRRRGLLEAGGELSSRGFTSRVSAGARMTSASQRGFAAQAKNMESFLASAHQNPRAGGAAARSVVGQGRTATSQALMMSGSGTLTGRAGGYMAGTLRGASGVMSPSVAQFANPQAQRGYARASSDIAKLGLDRSKWTARQAVSQGVRSGTGSGAAAGARLAGGRAAMAGSRAIPYVGTAILGYDIGKFAARVTGPMARGSMNFISDLNESLYAGAENRMMEAPFQDTEMTLNNRQRAVQAISNSRLNARSVLGGEAGQVAAHFG